jgi:hypothetical protein
MPVALACETPTGPVYLRTEADGSFTRTADPSAADLWEDAEALAAWIDALPEAARARLEGRPIRAVEITLDLDRGVTAAVLAASAAFLERLRDLAVRRGSRIESSAPKSRKGAASAARTQAGERPSG